MENDGFWRTVWRLRSMNNDKRTGSGSKLFLFIESLWQNQYWICLDREQTGPWAPDCYILEILQISIQFLILFGRHYGRNAQARPPSCPIFLPMAWKAHILRSLNQDAARINILESLEESSVLVVQDWAIKYLPRKYWESWTDWFGKRGISWHINVAFRKVSERLQMLTFAYIFQRCTQSS